MTTALQRLLERAESLYRDYQLGSVRAWKEQTGGLADDGEAYSPSSNVSGL